jgi:hypothetical protein
VSANANSSRDAKLLSDIQKFAASAGIPLPASKPPSAEPTSTTAEPASSPSDIPAPNPTTGNAAIDHCLAAYAEAHRKAIAAGRASKADGDGKAAYLRAMPPLVGPHNVADFIACIMRASIEDIIYPYEINKFLYAAQVANCVKNPATLPAPKRPRGRPSTAQKPLSEACEEDNSSVNIPAQN